MELGLDNWTAEFLSEELADRDDLGMMTLRQAIEEDKLRQVDRDSAHEVAATGRGFYAGTGILHRQSEHAGR